jgi:hypothetical protein
VPPKPTSFEEFWPYYVSQHLDPTNRWLHFVGTSMALGCIAISPVVPPALLAAPLVGYGFAWIGHFGVEKNRPATFGNPLWSLRGDFKMWSLMLRGRMRAEIEAVGREDTDGVAHAATTAPRAA